jgi:hypothetical protein
LKLFDGVVADLRSSPDDEQETIVEVVLRNEALA